MTEKPLVFVDANIWLDFYQARSEAGLSLLRHLESIKNNLLTTYQLEMEFKKNRQRVITETIRSLKDIDTPKRPAIFSNARAMGKIVKDIAESNKRIKQLRGRLKNLYKKPYQTDKVYAICQRIFHKSDAYALQSIDSQGRRVYRNAFRRYILGCPPRKGSDTAIGDAFNWEWIITCAANFNKNVIIVSRDSDYGLITSDGVYMNDYLAEEFKSRVGKKRTIVLTDRLSVALKEFKITLSQAEKKVEKEIINEPKLDASPSVSRASLIGASDTRQNLVSNDPYRQILDVLLDMNKTLKPKESSES